MKQKLTAAQIGCGKFPWAQDLPNLTAHPEVNLKYCCDIRRETAEKAAEHFHVPFAVTDYMQILNDPEVDFIKIATSHEAHLPIIEAAARCGKHVFCEKPMAMTDEEGYKIIRAVRKGGIKLCVDLNRRMSPAMHALKARYLEQKAAPRHNPWRYVETQRALLAEENLPHLLIRIQDESSSYGLGHLNPLTGGGEIIGESVHWLDLACWLFAPSLPVEITAVGSSRLSHAIYLRFDHGESMTLDFSCSGTFDYPKEQYELTHNAALFRSLNFVENDTYGIPGAEPEFFQLQYGPEIHGFESFNAYALRRAEQGGDLKAQELADPLVVDKGHRTMLAEFVKAIQEEGTSPCDELAGFRATYLANRAIASIELKQTLPVPLEKITPCIG